MSKITIEELQSAIGRLKGRGTKGVRWARTPGGARTLSQGVQVGYRMGGKKNLKENSAVTILNEQ